MRQVDRAVTPRDRRVDRLLDPGEALLVQAPDSLGEPQSVPIQPLVGRLQQRLQLLLEERDGAHPDLLLEAARHTLPYVALVQDRQETKR